MRTRFVLIPLILAAVPGCAHREVLPETTATPTYREQDLLEATAALGSGRHLDDRVALLETQMKAMRVELSRVSGATQRLEARQLQTVGVTPEPKSKAATPLEKPAKHKPEKSAAPDTAKAEPVDPRDPWAAPAPEPAKAETAKAEAPKDAAAPAPAAEAAHAETPPPPAEEKVASAAPAAAPAAPATAPAAGGSYAVQLGAFGSTARAESGWEELKSRGGALLSDLLPKREETSQGGKPVYRLKAGPLPDRDAAAKRCDALKAQSIPCLVTQFSGDWPAS